MKDTRIMNKGLDSIQYISSPHVTGLNSKMPLGITNGSLKLNSLYSPFRVKWAFLFGATCPFYIKIITCNTQTTNSRKHFQKRNSGICGNLAAACSPFTSKNTYGSHCWMKLNLSNLKAEANPHGQNGPYHLALEF